jgi:tRNA(His) 5'-end guanylyltransferase
MIEAVKEVLAESEARVAYTQSDEASFVFYEPDFRSELWFGGKPQKMASVVASMFTARFCRKVDHHLPAYKGVVPHFDGRAFQLPSLVELYNCLLWREQDARRNHVNAVAQEHFSHSELQHKSTDEKKRMLAQQHGVDTAEDFTLHQRRGTYLIEGGSEGKSRPCELSSFFSIKEVTINSETAMLDFCRTFGLPEPSTF